MVITRAPRFHLAARKNGIKAHIGAEITVQCPKSNVPSRMTDVGHWTLDLRQKHLLENKETISIPLLVRNRLGYQNLCRLITLMKLRVPKHAKPGECAATFEELAAHAEGLICLTGAEDGPLASALHHRVVESAEHAQRTAEWLVDIFGKGNVYAELQRHLNRQEEASNQAVVEIARRLQHRYATNGVCHATPAQRGNGRVHLHPQSCATGDRWTITGQELGKRQKHRGSCRNFLQTCQRLWPIRSSCHRGSSSRLRISVMNFRNIRYQRARR